MSQKKWKVWLQRLREKVPECFQIFNRSETPEVFSCARFWSKFKIVQKCLFLVIFRKEFFGKFLIFKFSNCKNKQKLSKPEFHCSEKLWAQKKEIDGKREREREREKRERERLGLFVSPHFRETGIPVVIEENFPASVWFHEVWDRSFLLNAQVWQTGQGFGCTRRPSLVKRLRSTLTIVGA